MLALGCVAPEVSEFLDARDGAICARHARCDSLADAGYASEADCVSALADTRGAPRCEGFDADAVDACLAAWDAACDTPPDLAPCDAVCE